MNQKTGIRKYLTATLLSLLSLGVGLAGGIMYSSSAQESGKVFELRIYTTNEGKLDDLNARFRNHTNRIFAKHGMGIVGFWTPTDEETRDNTLIYVLEHESQDAANASWRAFGQDPEWQQVARESNANGEILAGIERQYMVATDYSPIQ